ncbi:hypothetical protein [Marinilactibacillus piezotolerans]|uniref:hypothetical protein n=1 Tax=Marinilactibacillus piezotolerans TaxID=258723 RepID=UPI0009B0C603|nr:hypothetical protein [Marinilactibacillus piezotolerans]
MVQQNMLNNDVEDTSTYEYVVECREKTVRLTVDVRDVFYNADDVLDCPLDVVLRKNDYTLQDLMSWDAREVRFIQVVNGKENVINSVILNVNL